MSRWAALRQLMFPREFRISAPEWPTDLLTSMERRLTAVVESKAAATSAPDPQLAAALADVGVGLWRLRQRMLEPGTTRPLDEMRRAFRHLESTWDALGAAGVHIQDHTGEPFHFGRSIKVVAYQPTQGLAREKVLETIKPSVFFNGDPIQMGEVIVGTPEETQTPSSNNDHEQP